MNCEKDPNISFPLKINPGPGLKLEARKQPICESGLCRIETPAFTVYYFISFFNRVRNSLADTPIRRRVSMGAERVIDELAKRHWTPVIQFSKCSRKNRLT